MLEEVLHVPSFNHRILSVPIAGSNGCSFKFTENKAITSVDRKALSHPTKIKDILCTESLE
jgi:hypothetical protein